MNILALWIHMNNLCSKKYYWRNWNLPVHEWYKTLTTFRGNRNTCFELTTYDINYNESSRLSVTVRMVRHVYVPLRIRGYSKLFVRPVTQLLCYRSF
jgi:hypothetical protein